jgi:hypothetical protein
MKSCLYFPEEILEGFGVNRVKSANTDSSRKRRVVDNLHRPRSGSTGNDLVFGRLEKRERLTGSTEAEGDGEGGDTLVGPKVEGGDAERVEAARQRAAERGGEYGGSGDDEEQEDEYELDDDYGQAHGMSDDDGGGDDDDGDEAVF